MKNKQNNFEDIFARLNNEQERIVDLEDLDNDAAQFIEEIDEDELNVNNENIGIREITLKDEEEYNNLDTYNFDVNPTHPKKEVFYSFYDSATQSLGNGYLQNEINSYPLFSRIIRKNENKYYEKLKDLPDLLIMDNLFINIIKTDNDALEDIVLFEQKRNDNIKKTKYTTFYDIGSINKDYFEENEKDINNAQFNFDFEESKKTITDLLIKEYSNVPKYESPLLFIGFRATPNNKYNNWQKYFYFGKVKDKVNQIQLDENDLLVIIAGIPKKELDLITDDYKNLMANSLERNIYNKRAKRPDVFFNNRTHKQLNFYLTDILLQGAQSKNPYLGYSIYIIPPSTLDIDLTHDYKPSIITMKPKKIYFTKGHYLLKDLNDKK